MKPEDQPTPGYPVAAGRGLLGIGRGVLGELFVSALGEHYWGSAEEC